MTENSEQTYKAVYQNWQKDPLKFWDNAAKGVDWYKSPDTVFDPDMSVYGSWFAGGICNTSYNCLDRHVRGGRAQQTALIYDSPVTGSQQSYSYQELLDEVSTLAAALREHNVVKGDRVIIYMPMIPQAVFAMLACARLGAIHSVVFGGFAPKELATRIDDARPKLILSASCGIEPSRVIAYKPLLDQAIETASHKPEACLIFQREQVEADLLEGRDFDWRKEVMTARRLGRKAKCEKVAATDPLYILYTSGTTGTPKGVVRDNGGHMAALKWSMDNVYGVKPGDVYWAASDVGWVVGHSYIVYGPLLHGCTTVLFEGKPVGTPDAGTFWRVIDQHKVNVLFTAPTAIRAIKKQDPDGLLIGDYNLESFKTLFLAGERADPDTIQWAKDKLGVPVIDHWWQTETGWPIAANPIGIEQLPVKPGSSGVAMPGYDIKVLDEGGNPLGPGELGAICIKLPLPPGCLPSLWQNDARFIDSYLSVFPGYYETADAGFIDDQGCVSIMARTDDIINVAGHRLSTGGMEEILAAHPDVAECAVLGIADSLKGQIPIGFVVLKDGTQTSSLAVEAQCIALVRQKIGAVAALKVVIHAQRLPKTRSGKILRGTIRQIANGDDWSMPATIDDPVILDEISALLEARGFPTA